MSPLIRVATAAALLVASAQGALTLARVLASHMVLQRGVPATVWGFDTPGATVTTSFMGTDYKAVAGSDTIWRQLLPTQPSSGPFTLSFTSTSTPAAITLTDVLFGDVYLCTGQSNMEFSVGGALNATAEGAAANYPNIRITTVGQGTQSKTPLIDLQTIKQPWTAVTPQSIISKGTSNPDFDWFSAICYFSFRNVFNEMGGAVNFGLISDNWGGTA